MGSNSYAARQRLSEIGSVLAACSFERARIQTRLDRVQTSLALYSLLIHFFGAKKRTKSLESLDKGHKNVGIPYNLPTIQPSFVRKASCVPSVASGRAERNLNPKPLCPLQGRGLNKKLQKPSTFSMFWYRGTTRWGFIGWRGELRDFCK